MIVAIGKVAAVSQTKLTLIYVYTQHTTPLRATQPSIPHGYVNHVYPASWLLQLAK